jgi:hypothetical protein
MEKRVFPEFLSSKLISRPGDIRAALIETPLQGVKYSVPFNNTASSRVQTEVKRPA